MVAHRRRCGHEPDLARLSPGKGGYGIADRIGLSGAFDSPFYSVGRTVFRAVESGAGLEGLLCLMRTSPAALFVLYTDLAE